MNLGQSTETGQNPSAEHIIDKLDRKIIAALAPNGRRSYREIARNLDVSEATVRQRVSRLVDGGIIRITVVGNLITLGFEVVATAHIRVQPGYVDSVAERLTDYPHVRFVATSFGSADIVIQTLHHDVQSLHEFVSNELPRAAPQITRIDTFPLSNVLKSTWSWEDWFEPSS